MASKLTNDKKSETNGIRLDTKKVKFKVAIESMLHNNYEFKDLNSDSLKKFHQFLNETVGNDLTISTVDLRLRRPNNSNDSLNILGQEYEHVHYGKDRNPFRVFGYYNSMGYFVLTRIDPTHSTHS